MRRVFINGQFNSIDPQNNRYEAMACEDGKIIALGTKEEVAARYPD